LKYRPLNRFQAMTEGWSSCRRIGGRPAVVCRKIWVRLVVLHRDRLEGPPKVAVDASVATVHVVDRSARWENGVVSPGTPGQRTAKVSSSALMTAA
jgi:hypothetical protein